MAHGLGFGFSLFGGGEAASPLENDLLLEDGTNLLLEDGSNFLLE